MKPRDFDAEPTKPQHQGSLESLAVLLAMADWKCGIRTSELAALTDLPAVVIVKALEGLIERGRVVRAGNRSQAMWLLAHVAADLTKETLPW